MNDRRTGVALAFAAATISGFSVFLNAFAVKEFGDATLYTTAKNLVAGALLLLAGAAFARRGSAAGLRAPRELRGWSGLIAIGILGGGLAFWLFFQGLAHTSATSAAFVQKTLVIWVAVLAVAVLRERFTGLHAAAIGLLVIGQIGLSGGIGSVALGSGESLILIATLLWSVEVVIAKRVLRTTSALTVAAARMGIGVLVLGALSVTTGAASQLGAITMAQWGWALVTGVVLAAYVATWFSALARAQAIDVTAMLVFGAVITAVLSSGYRGTPLAPSAIGLGLIVAGTLLVPLAMRSGRAAQAERTALTAE